MPNKAHLANDTLAATPDARSTPLQGSNASDTRSECFATITDERPPGMTDDAEADGHPQCLSDTALATTVTLGESTCSSADMYKMQAHGNRGDRSPTVNIKHNPKFPFYYIFCVPNRTF